MMSIVDFCHHSYWRCHKKTWKMVRPNTQHSSTQALHPTQEYLGASDFKAWQVQSLKKWLHLVKSSSATPIIASKYHITTVLCNSPWLLSLQSSIFAPGTQNVVQISETKMELHYPKPQKPIKKKNRGFQTKSFQAFEEASTCFRSNDFGERTPNLHSEFDGIGCSLGPQIVPQFPGMMCRHDMWCVEAFAMINDKWYKNIWIIKKIYIIHLIFLWCMCLHWTLIHWIDHGSCQRTLPSFESKEWYSCLTLISSPICTSINIWISTISNDIRWYLS